MSHGVSANQAPTSQTLLHLLLSVLTTGMLVLLVYLWATASIQAAVPTAGPQTPAWTGALPAMFRPEVRYWAADIQRWAQARDLDPLLVATVMQIESCGDPHAVSRAGAIGLFQVMPYHFTAEEDPFAPEVNAQRGLDFLRRLWQQANGDIARTLAAYNGGPRQLTQDPQAWPAETQRYVAWGTAIYADAQAGLERSPALEAWLDAGGRALCRQAQARLGLPPPTE